MRFSMKKALITAAISCGMPLVLAGQPASQPPGWFSGSQPDTLEILVVGKALAGTAWTAKPLEILRAEDAPNPDYQYLTVVVPSNLQAQEVTFSGKRKGKKVSFGFSITPASTYVSPGLKSSDLIYLITPDRFANGDPSNDRVKGMLEKTPDRTKPDARHGGDIAGISAHLPYISQLGATAVWINPLLENNEPEWSYHGYAITNHYRIDPRFGTLDAYKTLVKEAHQRDLKVVMDVVYNHLGDQHILFQNPPSADWFNGPGFADGGEQKFVRTNYRTATLMDPHATPGQAKGYTDGWFDHHMPDINQRNPHVAEWLINNTLWWIESTDVDALRIDTYAYPNADFMAALTRRVKERFPHVFLFGEVWDHTQAIQSFFSPQSVFNSRNRALDAVTDFQLHYAVKGALTEKPAWARGIERVYLTLAADYLYGRPDLLVTFLDNHDEGRFYGEIEADTSKFKMGMALLMTLRGIPSLYYGTEIGLRKTNGHGEIREDFPGGFPGDKVNKFNKANLSEEEAVLFEYTSKLANFRKGHPALFEGSLVHFPPADGVYTYFRRQGTALLMVVVNTGEKPISVNPSAYEEVLQGRRDFEQIPAGKAVNLDLGVVLKPGEVFLGYSPSGS